MKNELTIKKCKSCGAIVKVIEDCNCEGCGIVCCGEPMEVLNMEKEHFIEWVSLVTDNKEYTVKLYPEQNAECRFPYIAGSCIYAYCNKHGLWKKEVE